MAYVAIGITINAERILRNKLKLRNKQDNALTHSLHCMALSYLSRPRVCVRVSECNAWLHLHRAASSWPLIRRISQILDILEGIQFGLDHILFIVSVSRINKILQLILCSRNTHTNTQTHAYANSICIYMYVCCQTGTRHVPQARVVKVPWNLL